MVSSQLSEPRHDKPNKMSVRPAKTQISLGIRPVWSESSLCAQWWAKAPSFLHADRTAKTLIRLGGCPGWSESSLGEQPHCCFVTSQLICHSLFRIIHIDDHIWKLRYLIAETENNVGNYKNADTNKDDNNNNDNNSLTLTESKIEIVNNSLPNALHVDVFKLHCPSSSMTGAIFPQSY